MERVIKHDSNCIDVGASRGALLAHMVRLAPGGIHMAFEPLPEYRRALAQRFPNVRVSELAVSDTEGRANFHHVVSNPAYSGLRRRAYERPDERIEEIVVETARLDDIVPQHLPVRFIKIDVEGAELQVLRGALDLVRRNRPFIVFEFGIGAADWYGSQPSHVYRLLTGCGLRISLMSDWLAGAGCLDERRFEQEFEECRNYYFVAHPHTG